MPVGLTEKTPGSGVGQGGTAPPGREPQEGVKVMESAGMMSLPSVGSDRLVREMKTGTPFAPTVVDVGIVGPIARRAPLTCAPAETAKTAERPRTATVAAKSEPARLRVLIHTSSAQAPAQILSALLAISKYLDTSISS